MNPDDIMPNDGTYFFPREDIDLALSRKKEKAQTLESVTVLTDLLKRWDEQIATLNSIEGIGPDVRDDPEVFMRVVNVNALVVEILKAEREYIQGLIDDNVR